MNINKKFDYTNFAFYGFLILFIIYLYYLKNNLNKNSLIIFGSLLVTIGYFFATYEKYNYLKNKSVDNINKSHLFLGSFKLLSFIIPINEHLKQTDIIGMIGNFILLNSKFGYKQLGYICQIIYYSLYVYRNGIKNELLDNTQAIAGGLILLYYIKKSIDKFYENKEKKLNQKKL
jgi:vacuolar-type H+-ATPase subunit I/STV1